MKNEFDEVSLSQSGWEGSTQLTNLVSPHGYLITWFLIKGCAQGWQKPGFLKKNPTQRVFLGFIGFFWVFLGFFGQFFFFNLDSILRPKWTFFNNMILFQVNQCTAKRFAIFHLWRKVFVFWRKVFVQSNFRIIQKIST